ncbi:putative iron export ATP-binding protein FetA [mine drainage metagenome]|uniref:Putative iron export ATP-binding protein FetA n=1 Tax=mine drainage metagenome TaxID=410659 RepID=A0A1J5RS76_9ZZZZ
MLEVRALRRFGGEPVSFSLAAGDCLAVRGPSGAGKSLLLRALADLDPSEGEVLWKGRARSAMPAPEWRRLVGYLPAEPGWWGDGVGEHFDVWPTELIARLGLPDDAASWPVSRPSTGERLRLALARALAVGPEVLMLDEPTSALDQASVAVVEALVAEKRAQGLAVLWVTHDPAQAARVARRHLVVSPTGAELLEMAE